MKNSALGALAALGLVTSVVGAARAGVPPYPASTTITGIQWDESSYESAGGGADIWATASASDGSVYAAWGDGAVGCRAKVSYGTAVLPGSPGVSLKPAGCGPAGVGKGKIGALVAVGTTLYGIVNLQDGRWPSSSFAVWRSSDKGRTWQKPSWRFAGSDLRPQGFVHYGPGYNGAKDGYVYMTAIRSGGAPKAVYLMRAPKGSLTAKETYQYFGGSSWSPSPAAARPVFEDRAGANGPSILYDAALGRYLLTLAHGNGGGRLGVFEATSPTGPWRTVAYEDRWLGMTGGDYLGVRFPSRWVSDGGKTLWGVFSCWGGGCGRYHDRLNLMRATLRTQGR
jgi:hypothetical protein